MAKSALIWLITVPMLGMPMLGMLGKKCTNCQVVGNSQIPRILHFNYMDGLEAFLRQERLTPEYMKGCVKHHAEWQVMFWDNVTAEALVTKYYPDFLPWWHHYDSFVKRSDALRPMLMHHFGGMYLDLDIECLQPAGASLQGYDIVMQGTSTDGVIEGLFNAMIAGTPGQQFWLDCIEELKRRVPLDAEPAGDAAAQTGPGALTSIVVDVFHGNVIPDPHVLGLIGASFAQGGTRVRIYPFGSWFLPCGLRQHDCEQRLESRLKFDPSFLANSSVVGRHIYKGSWNGWNEWF